MRMTYLSAEFELHRFVREAATHFEAHPEHWTYTTGDGSIVPGGFFACRWGADRDCVLVFRVDEDMEPTLFQNVMPRATEEDVRAQLRSLRTQLEAARTNLADMNEKRIDAERALEELKAGQTK